MRTFETSLGTMPLDRPYTAAELALVVELPEPEFEALFEARRQAWLDRYIARHGVGATDASGGVGEK